LRYSRGGCQILEVPAEELNAHKSEPSCALSLSKGAQTGSPMVRSQLCHSRCGGGPSRWNRGTGMEYHVWLGADQGANVR
jgi:hypothetical protein